MKASIHRENMPGDPRGVVRAQEGDRGRDVSGLTDPSQGVLLGEMVRTALGHPRSACEWSRAPRRTSTNFDPLLTARTADRVAYRDRMEELSSSDQRLALAHQIKAAISAACPGSHAAVRGSLARQDADEFSDLDLLWTVPRSQFGTALGAAPAAIASVRPLLALRSDPDFQASTSRRLLFARLTGVPVWWRLDLEIVTDDPRPSDGAPPVAAPVIPWDPVESALENALAAIKALGRGQVDHADGLLDRGFARIDHPSPDGARIERLTLLTATIVHKRPHLRGLAKSVLDQAKRHRA